MPSFELKCVSWNILADGMSSNEFITNGGDLVNTLWTSRRFHICQILQNFFEDKVHVIGLQENDHPYFILSELQKFKPEIRCIHLLAKDASRSADKLRLNAVFDYLNSNDAEFHNTTNRSNKSAQDYDYLYSRINDWYQRLDTNLDEVRKKFTMTSFEEEGAHILANVLKRRLDDLYVVNDGVSLYYDSTIIEFIEPIPTSGMTETEFPTLFMGHDLSCRFKIIDPSLTRVPDQQMFINIIGSHFKSGEGVKNEKRRAEQISDLIRLAKVNNEPSVILLDSNTSNLYRTDIEKSGDKDAILVDVVLQEAGFQNIIPTKGNECFKMRHARGNQSNKFGNIMFDTIDKIVVNPQYCSSFEAVRPNWLKTLPSKYYDEVLSWRIDDDKRKKLKSICCDNRWGDDMNKNDSTSECKFDKNILLQLYPNQDMPSDHPPVMAKITFKL